jgi:hypothetical protein
MSFLHLLFPFLLGLRHIPLLNIKNRHPPVSYVWTSGAPGLKMLVVRLCWDVSAQSPCLQQGKVGLT